MGSNLHKYRTEKEGEGFALGLPKRNRRGEGEKENTMGLTS